MEHYKRTIPKAGEKWQHFKGHVYEIIGFGNHTERMELVVIYHEAGDCTYWVRPLEKGSPPHVRERRTDNLRRLAPMRITPACAGKTISPCHTRTTL